MTRRQAEWCNGFSIFWLKKNGFLNKECSLLSGGIKWSYNGNEGSNIDFTVRRDNWGTPNERTYIQLKYTYTDNWSGEKSDVKFNVELATTPCNLGGKRYWFVCPLCKNGVYCGRKVGVLYSVGKYFGCRHCGNIAYQTQFEGGKFRIGSNTEPVVEKAYEEVKREYYNGKLTRKYKRYLKLRNKLNNNLMRALCHIGRKL